MATTVQASPYGTSVREFRDEPRVPAFRLDPLLLLATLGLAGCSLYTIATATTGDIDGSPYYFLIRQAAYVAVGLVAMLILSRVDYSRFREWTAGLYAAMIASILLVMAVGASARGSQRSIELGFFNFQASEVGKLLLILSLSGFLVDRVRRLGDRETTSRAVLMAVLPAMLVVAQPDLGSGLVYLAIVTACLFVVGTKWTHFAALAAVGGGGS